MRGDALDVCQAASAQLDKLKWPTREMAEGVTGSTTIGGRALCARKEGRQAEDTASAVIWKACGVRTYPAHDSTT